MIVAGQTPLKVTVAATAASLLLLLVVFELIRSRRLRERYALLWVLTGLVLVALSAWRGGLNTIAGWFGVQTYPPAVLFAVALLFVLAVLLHYSTVISKLADQNTILAQRLALLEEQIPSSSHAAVIARLRCFRGIDTLSAAGLAAEVGDFGRFARPALLAGFLGIVPSERTSDRKRRQGSITKAGSGHARRLLVEAAHHYRTRPHIGETLARRQQGQDGRVLEVAWRAQRRLHQRWQHLHHERRKPAGVVAIACARELAAFLWEAATLA